MNKLNQRIAEVEKEIKEQTQILTNCSEGDEEYLKISLANNIKLQKFRAELKGLQLGKQAVKEALLKMISKKKSCLSVVNGEQHNWVKLEEINKIAKEDLGIDLEDSK